MSDQPYARAWQYLPGNSEKMGVILLGKRFASGNTIYGRAIKIYKHKCRIFTSKCFLFADDQIVNCMSMEPSAGRCYFLDRRIV